MFAAPREHGNSAWDAGFRGSTGVALEAIAPPDVDRSLIRLAKAEARARLRLGRAAVRFVAMRGYDALGFVRLGDYAVERLGISGRELRSFASVAEKLAGLPVLAAAFTRGELSWSHLRLLAAVADASSEAGWVERSRGLAVRELAEVVRRERCGRSGADEGLVADAIDDETDATDGEPRVRFAIRCPARVTVVWRRAVELARRMLGSQAPVWQAAEAIAAEAVSGASVAIDLAGFDAAPPAAPSAKPPARRALLSLPASLVDDESAPESYEGLDAFDLDLEMRLLVRDLREADARLGHALRRSCDLRAHRALGFDSFDDFVRERLGLSPSKARSLVALDRRARESVVLGREYRSGSLSWVRALAILPVARGEMERPWVTRAFEVPVRRLRDEVEWAIDWRDASGKDLAPPGPDVPLRQPDLQTCAHGGDEQTDRLVTFFGPASVVALFRAMVAATSRPREPFWKGFERLLLDVVSEWESGPRHRDPIFARDGWRCAVPVCSSRRNLHDHHVEFRSRGGGNERDNRVATCASHHLYGIHRGIVRAGGRAPDDLVWELGVRPGRAPLLVLHGERYASPIDL